MYAFVDPNAGASSVSGASLQTIFNGHNLDEELTDSNGRFRTLSVAGRGILPRRIVTRDVPYGHGTREKHLTYEPRLITVRYLFEDKTNTGFRNRVDQMNDLLLGSQKLLSFSDESEAYFTATLQGGEFPEETSNSIVGTLDFICNEPSKKVEATELNIGTNTTAFNIEGQVETPWRAHTVFASPTNQYQLEAEDSGFLQLNYNFIEGDVLRIDYEKREVTLNHEPLDVAVSLNTKWFFLKPGILQLRASNTTTIEYEKRYY